MLQRNGTSLNSICGMYIGGVSTAAGATAANLGVWTRHKRDIFVGGFDQVSSVPNGYRAPGAWVLAQKSGGLAAHNTITGSGTASATGQSGYNIEADISGTGGVDQAQTFLGLIVTIVATISGTGTVSSAGISAITNLLATITGSGDIDAIAAGLADLSAIIEGEAIVNANNTALMDVAAQIRGYGDLTPEGIRDSVWSALLANYTESGTAGKALSTASSGGVDPSLLAAAVWNYATRSMPAAERDAFAAAMLAAAQVTPIHSNVQSINDAEVIGDGTEGDDWRGVGVQPQ